MDAEGFHEQTPCPDCGSLVTVTYYYNEGFTEIECQRCGYRSDAASLEDLQRAVGDLLERDDALAGPWDDLGEDDPAPPGEPAGPARRDAFETGRLFRSLKA